MIVVIDYGSGNLRSVAKGLEASGANVRVTADPSEVAAASHLVLPGVGAFADCHHNLRQCGIVEPMLAHIEAGRPFLGICVGMQLLFTRSVEFGVHPGLDLIAGDVACFSREMVDPDDDGRHLKVPHMGWNAVRQDQPHALWKGIPDHSHFYFVHSFHGSPQENGVVAGSAEYGIRFTAAVARDNLFATQFHPEKSQKNGLKLLENFVAFRP